MKFIIQTIFKYTYFSTPLITLTKDEFLEVSKHTNTEIKKKNCVKHRRRNNNINKKKSVLIKCQDENTKKPCEFHVTWRSYCYWITYCYINRMRWDEIVRSNIAHDGSLSYNCKIHDDLYWSSMRIECHLAPWNRKYSFFLFIIHFTCINVWYL